MESFRKSVNLCLVSLRLRLLHLILTNISFQQFVILKAMTFLKKITYLWDQEVSFLRIRF
jgi:hypothetical protein